MENELRTDTELATASVESSHAVRVEVLYDGPTAAGGVINPKDMMSKELNDAGFQVLVTAPVSQSFQPERSEAAQASRPATAVPPAAGNAAQPTPAASQPPAGLTVKEIFDFVRKAQQGTRVEEPQPPGGFPFLASPLFAASPVLPAQLVVAMRASMRRLREYQGIFSLRLKWKLPLSLRAARKFSP